MIGYRKSVIDYKLYCGFIVDSNVFSYRFIIHNDDNNPLVSSLEEFDKLLKEFDPNLLVISGLQMMDNYPYPKGKMTAQSNICLIRL
jgi:ADP-dependent glucokinase